MRHFVRSLVAVGWLVLVPVLASAQTEITGVVKDTSGAVLPGVTVEAASPALIEKVRTVVTDGDGRYRVVDLRPGVYTVTFTLSGFSAIKREGVETAGTGTFQVNADLRVGSLEETITVTGAAPLVDVQSVTRQRVMGHDVIDNVPSARTYSSLGVLIPGVSSTNQDVGGNTGDPLASLTVHGSRAADQRVLQNGVNVSGLAAAGNQSGTVPNMGAAQEMTIDTGSASAELAQGGPRINFIPRDGGNTLKGSVFGTLGDDDFLLADNLTQRLKDRGLLTANTLRRNWDVNPGFGGPVRRDTLWYYASGRHTGASTYAGGMFVNKNAYNPTAWTYEADPSQRALAFDRTWWDAQVRMTWQANAKNKFAGSWDQQVSCQCPNGVSATTAPEAAADFRFPTQRILTAEWSSPVTNRLLVEAVGLHRTTRSGPYHLQPRGSLNDAAAIAAQPLMISVLEQSSGLTYRAAQIYQDRWSDNYFYRAAVSYITGSHALKVGFNNIKGSFWERTYDFQPTSYRFNNGVPNQITIRATPYRADANEDADLGLYVQDRWTLDRLTLSVGVRYDDFRSSFPEQRLGPGPLVPSRNLAFPAQDNLGWRDLTPRIGAVYDVFGDGKTAVKVSLNKYLEGQALGGLARTPSPTTSLVLTTARSWNDRGGLGVNNDYIPQCTLTNPDANGECGAMVNRNFGGSVVNTTYDPDLLTGWGHRPSNWEFSAGAQREIVPRVSLDVSYFRRWYNNFQVTDNLLVDSTDYAQFTFAAPADARLPNGGGYAVTGLDLNPTKVGLVSNLVTLSDKYGTQTEHWNGVDVSVSARTAAGLVVAGGVSSGKRTTDNCDVVAKVPEALLGAQLLSGPNPASWLPAQFCRQAEPLLTQVKGLAVYTIPRVDVLVSGTLQSVPGPQVAANYTALNALVAPSLGRPLSGGAANIVVNVLEPGSLYGERLNQIDLRFGKVLRYGRTKATLSLDVYNVLNGDTVLTQNNNFAVWQRPQSILQARFAKISAQFDF